MPRWTEVALAGLLLVLSGSGSTAAAQERWYALQVQGCPPALLPELMRLVSLALLDQRPAGSAQVELGIACKGEQTELRVSGPQGAVLTRLLPPLPHEVRARTLALQIAEMLEAAHRGAAAQVPADLGDEPPDPMERPEAMIPEPDPLPLVPDRPPLPPAPVRVPRAAARPRVSLSAAAALDVFLQGGPVLGGAGPVLGANLTRRLSLGVSVLGQGGQAEVLGWRLSMDSFSGGVGLFFRQAASRLYLRAGGGLRLSAARVRGERAAGAAADSGSFWAVILSPTASLGIGVNGPRRLHAELGAEVGYVLWPVQVFIGDAQVLTVAGPVLGLRLGLGLSL